MRILNVNTGASATLTYSSQLEKYPFSEAFADPALSRWGKFAGNSAQYLQYTFTGAVDIYDAYLLNTNLSASATVKLQCSSNNFSSVAAEFALVKYGNDWIYQSATALNYRYFRIFVTDTSITYPRLSKAYIGSHTQMPGFNPEIKMSWKSNSDSAKTDSGQLIGFNRVQLRGWSVSFDAGVATATDRANMESYFATYDKTVPAVWLLAEDSLDVEPPIYANLTKDIEFTKTNGNGVYYKYSLELEECK